MTVWRWSEFFHESEFRCKHTGDLHMDPKFMDALFMMRKAAGFPFYINSGYRHPTHPVEAAKRAPGTHTLGMAVDIAVRGDQALWVLENARKYGFNRIGVAQKTADRFLHLDTATMTEGFPSPALWSY